MTVEQATKIAEDFCKTISENRHAVYRGMFEGAFLFKLKFNHGGHHGHPIFVVIDKQGKAAELEQLSDIYYKAWLSSNNYAESLQGN